MFGALADEMAIREHTRVGLLVRVAAHPQAVDAEHAEIERLQHPDEAGIRPRTPSSPR